MKHVAFLIVTALLIPAARAQTQPAAGASPSTALPPAQSAPTRAMPAPAAPTMADVDDDYKIGAQDLLDISVYGQPELTRTVQVNARGRISIPLVGTLEVAGLTSLEIERLIASRLSENLLQNPQVTVFVKESLTARFTVEGAVGHPGVFPLKGQVTLLRALALAGGRGSLGDLTNVRVFRINPNGTREQLTYDIEKIRVGEAVDPTVQNDDLIVVNQSKVRAALKDSAFSDFLGLINPFSFLK